MGGATSSNIKSQIAVGLEQGLRDTSGIIACVTAQWRPSVEKAFRDAISAEYPDFFNQDSRRLDKVLARGKVNTEREFYLVRHLVDTLAGDPSAAERVKHLHFLLGAYEGRG